MSNVTAFLDEGPPLHVATALVRDVLVRQSLRLAFAGRAGSGKTTLCELIAGTSRLLPRCEDPIIPILNHADGIKEEVLEWVARAKTRALIPEEEATLDDFCDFLGISPRIIREYMWDLVGPLWEAMAGALTKAYDVMPNLTGWTQYAPGESVEAKVAFVDAYKPELRLALQRYGEVIKELGADPLYWVNRTVARSLVSPMCLNGDTRFTEEIEVLRGVGWTVIYLSIDDAAQALRRPDLTPAQLEHVSEHGMVPEDCDLTIDATQPLARVMYTVAQGLAPRRETPWRRVAGQLVALDEAGF